MKDSAIEYRNQLHSRVLEVADEMFRERGFRAVRMDDVSHALNISKRTLYEIYPNKEDLIIESIKTGMERTYEVMERSIAQRSDLMDILADCFRMHIADIRASNPVILADLEFYPRACKFLEGLKEQRLKDRRKFFERGQEEGYILPDINLDLLDDLDRAWADYFSKERLYAHYTPDELFRNSILLFVRSVCTEKGVRRVDEMLKTI